MKRKVAELSGALLDEAVIRALDSKRSDGSPYPYGPNFKPSSKWENGGPIIARERITILAPDKRLDQLTYAIWTWTAVKYLVDDDENEQEFEQEGPTPLVAAMRAYVASKFGEDIDL